MAAMTYEEYLRTGEETTDYELVEGELVLSPSANARHGEVLLTIGSLILELLKAKPGLGRSFGDIDVKLSDQTVLRPDVSFVSAERLKQLHIDRNIEGPPDLVIEILSPSNASFDRKTKRELYQKYGVSEYWIVSPEAEVVQLIDFVEGTSRLYGVGERFTSPVLGSEIEVDRCFSVG